MVLKKAPIVGLVLLLIYLAYHTARFRRIVARAGLPPIQLDFETDFGRSEHADKQLTVLAVGDSTSMGVGGGGEWDSFGIGVARAMANAGRAVRFVNYGVEGALTSEVVSGQLPRAVDLKPELTLLSVGGNDVIRGTAPRRYRRLMRTLITELSSVSGMLVVLDVPAIGMMPALPRSVRSLFDLRARQLNRVLRSLASGKDNVVLVSIYDEMRNRFAGDPECFCADGHHPSAKGYALWTDAILRKLASYGYEGSGQKPPKSLLGEVAD